MNTQKIGGQIRAFRERLGLTQSQLAEKIGVTASAVGNYERDFSFPKKEVLDRLFLALQCTPNELFGIEEQLSDGEKKHLENYKKLDEYGKQLVDLFTEQEISRRNSAITAVAARNGSMKSKVHLVKRKGKRGIWDAPDYKGGR